MSYVFINNSILVVFSVLSADPRLRGRWFSTLEWRVRRCLRSPSLNTPTPTPPHPTHPPLSDVNGI